MVAVWIILGFLAGGIFNTTLGLMLGMRRTKCSSLKEYTTYASAAVQAKSEKNETNQPVSAEINYADYSETLELK